MDGKSSDAQRRQFEAVARNPQAPERELPLVNVGTEGWNCPSLFATALVRKRTCSTIDAICPMSLPALLSGTPTMT